ncbi:LysM peptidoglycan-binding domain-containing protein [Psychrobacillus psychrodurans]|uniref:LysM peptidoglycan-binding domain-containing protein n=1 Tax=Psychrobacillus psychrodurans TaxID=126157 RepID=A0A9X3RB63_9BACI|nr:LysM peptidoglycan-binding domain-containing protein [Psychrobacillus psychrodurans]MCZ8533792.1 LysM peptidoglycan-binding domain-containing protein [Psychrobacillus psychrodurans]
MKKHIIALTAIATLSVGAAGQASASSVHTVEKGDTLWSISQAENVSVQDLQQWNDLNSTIIFPSQQLKVEEALETYVVVSGDTLSSIAKKHNITIEQLMNSNQLTSDLIIPGDKLVLEGSNVIQPKVSAASTTSATSNAPTSETKATSSVEKELTMTSTAYTASCAGCSGITATGINLKENPNQKVISVDPNVIPLGSRVWVEGYGEAIAGDTGGSIKGNKIDIFIPSKQAAINWGHKTVKVKILN